MARVLVAEDNGPLRHLLREVLSAAGHEVYTAADGATALELAQRVAPELLVTDYLMPSMDGVELARSLWATPALDALPVIVFTAFSPDDKVRPLVQEAKVNYIVKGHRLSNLVKQVDTLLESRQA